jgi:hypothetical protein
VDVLGRLPLRYRATIWVAGLVTFTTLGAWLGLNTTAVVWSAGAAVGAFLGAIVVTGFLHVLEGTPTRHPR